MEIPENDLMIMNATEEDVRSVISTIQRWVLKVVPDAKVMYGTNKRGEINSVAIYDCKVAVDHKGHLNAKYSTAPQRISMIENFSESWQKQSPIGYLKLVANLWADALLNQIKLGNVEWYKVRRDWLP